MFINNLIFTDDQGNPTDKKAILKFNYDYITVPLKIGFNYGNTVFSFANMSLAPAILVDAKTITPDIDFDGTVIPGETVNTKSKVNMFDIGGILEVGGGYKFNDKYWLFTSFSYQQSFTSLTNADYFASSKIKHYGMTINAGLKCAMTK